MAAVLPIDPSGAAPSRSAPVARKPRSSASSFGKYREIIIAVGFFLLFIVSCSTVSQMMRSQELLLSLPTSFKRPTPT